MTDKDILISDLNDISEILNNNGYGGWCATIRKAVSMLKEQDAKMVAVQDDGCTCCPTCGNELYSWPPQKYCDECGQAVKWK